MLAGRDPHAGDGDARRQRLPAACVGRVERGQRGLRRERAQEADEAALAARGLDALAHRVARDEARDGAQDDLALDLLPLLAHLGVDVDGLLQLHEAAVEPHLGRRPFALAGRERREVDPRDEPLRGELVRGLGIAGVDVVRHEREREADGNAIRDLVGDAPEAHDEDDLAGLVVRLVGLAALGQRAEAWARVGAAGEEPVHRPLQAEEAREARGLVVEAQGLVGVVALLEGEPREVPAEAEDGVVLLAERVAHVLLHDDEPARLDLRALEVPRLQVVQHVERVDEELLVRRRDVLAGGVAEDVLADRVARVVREVQHVDRLVGRLKIALRGLVLGERLLDRGPVEHEERVVAFDLLGELIVLLDAHLLVQGGDRLARAPLVEGRPHGQGALGVAAAALREGEQRQRHQQRRRGPGPHGELLT